MVRFGDLVFPHLYRFDICQMCGDEISPAATRYQHGCEDLECRKVRAFFGIPPGVFGASDWEREVRIRDDEFITSRAKTLQRTTRKLGFSSFMEVPLEHRLPLAAATLLQRVTTKQRKRK